MSRPRFQGFAEGLTQIYEIVKSKVGESGSIVARLRGVIGDEGDDDETTDDSERSGLDVEEIDNATMWGIGSILARPASPTSDGRAEAIALTMGDTREVIGWRDLRWQLEHDLAKGDAVLRWLGETGGGGQPTERPRIHLKADGSVEITADVVRIATKDAGTHATLDGGAQSVSLVAPHVNLAAATPSDAMALASKCNDRLDDIDLALDALCGAVPVPTDGGAAIQALVRGAWRGSLAGVPTSPSDVGSTKIKGE